MHPMVVRLGAVEHAEDDEARRRADDSGCCCILDPVVQWSGREQRNTAFWARARQGGIIIGAQYARNDRAAPALSFDRATRQGQFRDSSRASELWQRQGQFRDGRVKSRGVVGWAVS
jgi:hypothetical protein